MQSTDQQDKAEVNFSIRMPGELHQWLSDRAGRNYRSKVSELLFLLEKVRAEELTQEAKG